MSSRSLGLLSCARCAYCVRTDGSRLSRPRAEGTDITQPTPLPGGVRAHLARRKDIRIDHVLEQVVARHPTAYEAELLDVARDTPMLALYVAARDAAGKPVLVLELVM